MSQRTTDALGELAALLVHIPGVEVADGGDLLYRQRVIGSITPVGSTVHLQLMVHSLDLTPIMEEYPFASRNQEGAVLFMLLSTPDDRQKEAIIESIRSSVDLVDEELGEAGPGPGREGRDNGQVGM